MHPVVNPAQPRGLIGPDYLAAVLADLTASVRLVIFPGGIQQFPERSLPDSLGVGTT
jgi:hypothetical protein